MKEPYRHNERPPQCEGRWMTRDGLWVHCQFDANHAGPCWDWRSKLPPSLSSPDGSQAVEVKEL